MSKKVVVFDYGSGNVFSACRALERAGAEVELTGDYKIALETPGLLVPGVGAFANVMKSFRQRGGDRLIDLRLSGARAVLGICVGMQIMFESGNEHGEECSGLGQWPGQVEKLKAPVIPHMGWSKIEAGLGSMLFSGIAEERFYFVHSYAVKQGPEELLGKGPLSPPISSYAEHGEKFVAAVENGVLMATQFHPEKSGAAGVKLLENWLKTL